MKNHYVKTDISVSVSLAPDVGSLSLEMLILSDL